MTTSVQTPLPIGALPGSGDSRWRRRLRTAARICVVAAGLLLLLVTAGEVPGLPEAATVLAGTALVLVALGLPRRWHLPRLGWILAAAVPAVAVMALQVCPWLGGHPWTELDRTLLGQAGGVHSIDPGATRADLGWVCGLAALAAAAALLWPGERAWRLAGWLVGLGAVHAALAVILAPIFPDFPSAIWSAGRVRGSFVYPNHAAAFWAMLLPLALALSRWRDRRFAWAAAALAAAVVLSASRGGTIVMLAVSLPVLAVVLPRSRRRWALPLIVVCTAAWLWLVNLQPVTQRFLNLEVDAATLNGRLHLWRAILPVASSAGPLGSGAGTTELAWRRGGESCFEPLVMNHAHSDPLELWLELGWLGAAAVVAGLGVALALARRRPGKGGGWSHPLAIGGGCGLLHLAIHGGAEFLISNPAIAITAALLAIVTVRGLGGRPQRDAPGALRWLLLGGGALVLAGGIVLLPHAAADRRARKLEALDNTRRQQAAAVDDAARARLRQGDPPPPPAVVHDPGFLASLRTGAEPDDWRLDTVLARLWLDQAELVPPGERGPWMAMAEQALAAAGRDCPASAEAWCERARLAALREPPDPGAAFLGLERLQAWAPGWLYGQWTGILLAARPPAVAEVIAPSVGERSLDLAMAAGRPMPGSILDAAGQRWGFAAIAARVVAAPDALRAAAADWLCLHGTLEQWRDARRLREQRRADQGQDACQVAPAQMLAAQDLLGPRRWLVRLGITVEERREQAVQLVRAGLPVPPELAAVAQMVPGVTAPFPDLADPTMRSGMVADLRDAGAWADPLRHDLDAVEQACIGDASAAAAAPPSVLLRLAEDPHLQPALRDRLRQIAMRAMRPSWATLPGGVWSWWFDTGEGPHTIDLPPGRVGLVVDGVWHGWWQGMVDLRTTPGMHRVVVLRAL